MLFAARRSSALLIMPSPQTFQLQKAEYQSFYSEVSFVSILAMVLSEYWKRLEENFRNKINSSFSQNDKNYENIFPPTFFNILKEPLVIQNQTIHQQKAWDLSYLEPGGQGRGTIRRVPRPFAAKSIFWWFFTGAWRVFDSLPSMASLGDFFKVLTYSLRIQIADIKSFLLMQGLFLY